MLRRLFRGPPSRPVTIDRVGRDEMARLVRAWATRRIDNFRFEEQAGLLAFKPCDDPAVHEAYHFCWQTYDDFRRHKLPRLDREQRRRFARIILFLRSDEPYCWLEEYRPRLRPGWVSAIADAWLALVVGIKVPLLALLSLGVRVWLRSMPRLVAPRAPDREQREQAWPFPDVESLRRAEGEVLFLHGVPCA